ncbi:UPF0057-domain-containing protein [Polychaeton citri CBS 116435]|uniref:UPF0057-domain-containing protein n=1 Tax=Polychaeton citri CBS 116435 TaxID=1314669 RepID=A0A9P4PZM6_9PEZI|nr:UPF0057-domain-containing protein [Polychaeton citri CBS 116435]
MASSGSDVCLYLLAIFVPPLAVVLKVGCGASFLINICLTIFGWIPGLIHAWWIVGRNDPARHK